MKSNINSGCYPVMLTPFFEDLSVDYEGLQRLTEWYIQKGCQGLFAVCGSSEMTSLSLEERIQIARTVVKTVGARDVDIVASGHTGYTLEEQIEEINEISKAGIDAFVLVSSRIAHRYQDDQIFIRNLERILARTGDTMFGIYECPSPYNRQLSPEIIAYLANTGRFVFTKDTACSYAILDKIKAAGSSLKIFNAFTPLLLDGMKAGGQGYCGIHANYFPDLYVKLWERFRAGDEKRAEQLQAFLTVLSETSMPYNTGTKYYLNTFEGVEMGSYSRSNTIRLSDFEKEKLHDYYLAVSQIRALFEE